MRVLRYHPLPQFLLFTLEREARMMKFLRVGAILLLFACAYGRAADFSAELAKVKSGQLKEARAEWWGYNPQDSTESLQAALNSGAKKLIISRQSGPWMTKAPLLLPSDMEIVFEKGAEIRAMPGYFKGIGDCLMKAQGRSNLTIRGRGIGTMRKADYQNPKEYKPAEWRHTLGLFGCTNVRVEDLTLRLSGGDGIYVNDVKDLVVEGVVLDGHHRQGISVINAENLLIRNCVIKNTRGTAPQCGIDLEPNKPEERLVNCRIENCLFENNHYAAVNLSIGLDAATPLPVQVVVENCLVRGGNYAFSAMTGSPAASMGKLRRGTFIIRNCTVEKTKSSAFYFSSHSADAEKIIVENCTIVNPSLKVAPIAFLVRSSGPGAFGGVAFKNCTFKTLKAKAPLSYVSLASGARLADVTGTILFNGKKIELNEYAIQQGYQKDPVMIDANVPLLGFPSLSAVRTEKLPDEWRFQIDPENIGLAKRWQATPPERISTWPSLQTGGWEKSKSSSSELQKQLAGYDGIGWYAQNITVPKEWKGGKIYLYCGAIDESGDFFLNGKLAGKRLYENPDDWLLPFAVRIDHVVDWRKPEQQLVIRVQDTGGQGGIWKPVWLISELK